MFGELVLGLWSAAGIAWWLIAWWLVSAEAKPRKEPAAAQGVAPFISIFKPLPPLGEKGLRGEAEALESFIGQLDTQSELLLGVHEADREAVAPFLERMGSRYPAANLQVIFRSEPDEVVNPKVAWQKILAAPARGELWLWSDIDIVAPERFLVSARAEFGRDGTRLLTFPYVVRGAALGPALLDALYVNVEFYPGVLFLGRRGPVDFGLGAALLFRRDDFLRDVGWEEVGAALADDFVLGQKLKPVRLSETTVATMADVASWSDALLHYLRWSKTVWWNRPAGAAARIAVLPVWGWALYVGFHASNPYAWIGLMAMVLVDVLFAALLCRRVGFQWQARNLLATGFWSLWRIAVWIACWLPWPVVWRGSVWWSSRPKVKSTYAS